MLSEMPQHSISADEISFNAAMQAPFQWKCLAVSRYFWNDDKGNIEIRRIDIDEYWNLSEEIMRTTVEHIQYCSTELMIYLLLPDISLLWTNWFAPLKGVSPVHSPNTTWSTSIVQCILKFCQSKITNVQNTWNFILFAHYLQACSGQPHWERMFLIFMRMAGIVCQSFHGRAFTCHL